MGSLEGAFVATREHSPIPRLGLVSPKAQDLDAAAIEQGMQDVAEFLEKCALHSEPMRPIVAHILGAPGKRLRAQLCLLFGTIDTSPVRVTPDCVRAAAAVELLHEASLVHDDVCDGSELRRDRPSVCAAFDLKQASWSGVFLAATALALTVDVQRRHQLTLDLSTLRRLSEGQLLEMLGSGDTIDDLKQHYLQVASGKTGALFDFACSFGAELSGLGPKDLALVRSFAQNLSIAFQVLDDVRDVEAPADLGKPWGTDLRLGIPTWPVLECAALRGVRHLSQIFDPQGDSHALRRALLESGALERARAFAATHLDGARAALATLRRYPGAVRIENWLARLEAR